MEYSCDYLVIGSGVAGLSFALKMADKGEVIVLSKTKVTDTNTSMAQGGIAAVVGDDDSFEKHIKDTLVAGAGLCREDIVRLVVEQAPDRIEDLQKWGVRFEDDLTREGGHSTRRILHFQDHTGFEIQQQLTKLCRQHPNIQFLEDQFAIDLITNKKLDPSHVGPTECIGCYTLNRKTNKVESVKAGVTVLSTGGAGKVYLYTSNWDGATGDGIAMAQRAGARIANMEFMQFHPTCLYHPHERNFLISEALRGEGGELINAKGEAFMKKYHKLGALAPRDIVARSIDEEIKISGADCVYLDMTHKPAEELKHRFPLIHKRCLDLGIDLTKKPIPVVPAAHYLCGGVLTDKNGRTDVENLYAIGETACTGLHGANRLASNSLLECVVFAHQAATDCMKQKPNASLHHKIPEWVYHGTQNPDEMIVISHMWDEIRRLMWNYVGIVRSNRRLERALNRIQNIRSEIKEYYWNFKVHSDILELRNIAQVAHMTVLCALSRKESRGIHFNLDYREPAPVAPKDSILSGTLE